mmetsp:Transcript_6012/g.11500  ORF Transcript_6012/g.11500 Transcript_6012/m.11500 type:complete len:250 (-) Transcript_6012:171-920(-)
MILSRLSDATPPSRDPHPLVTLRSRSLSRSRSAAAGESVFSRMAAAPEAIMSLYRSTLKLILDSSSFDSRPNSSASEPPFFWERLSLCRYLREVSAIPPPSASFTMGISTSPRMAMYPKLRRPSSPLPLPPSSPSPPRDSVTARSSSSICCISFERPGGGAEASTAASAARAGASACMLGSTNIPGIAMSRARRPLFTSLDVASFGIDEDSCTFVGRLVMVIVDFMVEARFAEARAMDTRDGSRSNIEF